MRKRRRLADKLTIMVCAVLCAVSAFFYVPMEVCASSNSLEMLSHQFITSPKNSSYEGDLLGYMDLTGGNEVFDTLLYEVDVTFDLNVSSDFDFRFHGFNVSRQTADGFLPFFMIDSSDGVGFDQNYTKNYSMSYTGKYYLYGSKMRNAMIVCHGVFVTPEQYLFNYSVDLNYTVNSVTALSDSDSEDYQNGYNAGYAEGETAGYGNGYSNGFADGEASVDTDAIYDEAFQAGKDSVDTQSYYDAGYQAGYQVAYSAGYESGYDVGYQDAMDRIANWGADTAEYPLLVFNKSVSKPKVYVDTMSNIPNTSYGMTSLFHLDFDVNPNHTYKFVFSSSGFYTDTTNCLFSYDDLGFTIGDLRFSARYNTSWKTNTVFISGDSVGSVVNLDAYVYEMRYYGGVSETDDFVLALGQVIIGTHGDVSLMVYDMGPSGDTQNHIANQTDQLTNGFDESQGNSVNSDLSTGLNEYQTAEDSLWATATTGLKDFTFFDFESVPAMITGMSFITSIMGSWFSYAGGASGVGIVLSILFSVMLVAMVLGLYRLYQSKGGKK